MEFALWFVHRVPYSPDLIVIIQADPTELVTAFDTFIKNGQWEKIKRCGCLWLPMAEAGTGQYARPKGQGRSSKTPFCI